MQLSDWMAWLSKLIRSKTVCIWYVTNVGYSWLRFNYRRVQVVITFYVIKHSINAGIQAVWLL